jgi:DNA polymerase III subunit chi
VPEISFYVLPTESTKERYLFVCKLIEKAYRSGSFAYVLTHSMEQNQLIDNLLWTFRPGSFIPHQVYTGELPLIDNSILIGSGKPPENWRKVLINMSPECPQEFQKIEKIFEILDNSEETKTWGRQRYRQYQQVGIEIITHNMG